MTTVLSSTFESHGAIPLVDGADGARILAGQEEMSVPAKPLPRLRQEGSELLPETDPEVWKQDLRAVLGINDPGWAVTMLNSALNAVPGGDQHKAEMANSIIAALAEMELKGGMEAMLAVQIVVTHLHAMRLLARASSAAYPGLADSHYSNAQRLLKLFLQQSSALSGLRQQGQQRVNVEQINIHGGAQAIVGIVNGRQHEHN